MREKLAALVVAGMLLAACGGGRDEGPPPITMVPSGTWFGAREDSAGVMGTFEATTSGTRITQIRNNGVVAAGLTGTFTHQSGSIYSFTLSDGTVGGFFLNSAQTHGAFVDEEFAFGVVQRGASALPSYSFADLNGSYSSMAVSVAANFGSFSASSGTATTCHSMGNITVISCTTGGSTTGPATITNLGFPACPDGGGSGSTFGRWCGGFAGVTGPTGPLDGTTGTLRAFLSADKRFAAVWACRTTASRNTAPFPTGCEFFVWAKQ